MNEYCSNREFIESLMKLSPDMRIITIIVIITFLSTYKVTAQKVWSLEECIEYALTNNLSLKERALDIRLSKERIKSATMGYFPSLNLSVEHNLNWGRSVDLQTLEIVNNQLTQNTGIGLGSSIYILDGGGKIFNSKIGRVELQISELNLEASIEDLKILITKSYLEGLLSKELLAIIDGNLNTLNGKIKELQEKVEMGEEEITSLLELKSQLAAEKREKIAARNNLDKVILNLKVLLNIPHQERLQLEEPELEERILTFRDQSDKEVEILCFSHPKIKSLEKKIEMENLMIKKARGALFPKIGLSAAYSTFYSSTATLPDGSLPSYFQQLGNNINPSINISLTIPIFNNREYRMEIERGKIERERALVEFTSARNELLKEFIEVRNEIEVKIEELNAAKEHLAYCEKSFEYATLKFENGIITGRDYTDIRNTLHKAQSQYLRAKYQYLFQLKIMDIYCGNGVKR